MKDDIESEGFQQLVEEVTRSWPGVPSSTLDHIWTNTQESIMSIKKYSESFFRPQYSDNFPEDKGQK